MEIGGGEVTAGVAVAVGDDGLFHLLVHRISDVLPPLPAKEGAVAGDARGQGAIEDITTPGNGFDDVFGRADPHQVARLAFGEAGYRLFNHSQGCFLGLADTQAADGITGEV
ncbi:hypothetical protein ES708_34199 [subsurface metagenome]